MFTKCVFIKCVWTKCVDKVCVDKVCVDKVCVDKVFVDKVVEEGGRRRRRRSPGYRIKNKNPTQRCGEQVSTVNQPRKVSQVIKRLPKPSDHERAISPVPLVHSSASASQPSTCIPQESYGQPNARIHHSQTVQYHDHRTQQVNVGVDPMDFANMVSEAKRVVQESDERIKGLEGLAQDVYSQACSSIQELLGVVESLQLSNQGFQNQIHQLNSEVANARAQLELQVTRITNWVEELSAPPTR